MLNFCFKKLFQNFLNNREKELLEKEIELEKLPNFPSFKHKIQNLKILVPSQVIVK